MQTSFLDQPAATKAKRFFDRGASSEWFTPSDYLAAARSTMGGIDLDPASCALANQVVRASRYFDREADGLRQRWHGRVWLNPPYSDYAGQAATWAAKLLAEYEAGNVQQAILLVNFNTASQGAMQRCIAAGSLCIVNHRIKFVGGGEQRCSPTQGNMLIYLGERQQEFAEHFGQMGVIK